MAKKTNIRKSPFHDANHWMYWGIAQAHLRLAHRSFGVYTMLLERAATQGIPVNKEWFLAVNEATQSATIATVFAGLAAEAYINHLAIEKLDTFRLEGLDKLTTEMKWVIVPKLIYRKGIEPSSHVVEGLKRLAKLRNQLVHFKSKPLRMPLNPTRLEARVRDAEGAVKGVSEAIKALHRIDPKFEKYRVELLLNNGGK
ncbi:hypothetical protein BH10PLA2_BH10PLA2_25420 [soil metagenome]